jgi:hypothetical protein
MLQAMVWYLNHHKCRIHSLDAILSQLNLFLMRTTYSQALSLHMQYSQIFSPSRCFPDVRVFLPSPFKLHVRLTAPALSQEIQMNQEVFVT